MFFPLFDLKCAGRRRMAARQQHDSTCFSFAALKASAMNRKDLEDFVFVPSHSGCATQRYVMEVTIIEEHRR